MLSTLALTVLLAQTRAARPEATPTPGGGSVREGRRGRKEGRQEEGREGRAAGRHEAHAHGGRQDAVLHGDDGLPPAQERTPATSRPRSSSWPTRSTGAALPPRRGRSTFSFNGGPGAASVWLHMGALGPKRVKMKDADGMMPAPPYTVVDNEETWLPDTDMVFIDPVGTGYSRPAKPDLGKKFWGLDGDIASVGEFIRLYLTRYERWGSPLFLVGESYGTTRAAGLSGYLVDRGIAFNGILLVSSILNFQTARLHARQRPALPALPPDVHGDRLVPQEAPRRPAGQAAARRARRGGGVRGRRVPGRAREG